MVYLSGVAITALLRDIWRYLMISSTQPSGGRLLGRRLGEGVVEARMSMAWAPDCRRHMYMRPNGSMRRLRMVVVRGGCSVTPPAERIFQLPVPRRIKEEG